jgi:D-beta-D-heptose 7-phosphate kinase/D-beta-D-heptose 1-phosphate adenosyltransferase
MGTVLSLKDATLKRKAYKGNGKRVVFTNGVFDIIHRGHVEYLAKARSLGDALIVGINSDDSVRRIKGDKRPVVTLEDRAFVLANLLPVDVVCAFDEDTPYNLISAIVPDVLVKGADWNVDDIVGKDIVLGAGGKVETIEYIPNRSTSGIIERILERFS